MTVNNFQDVEIMKQANYFPTLDDVLNGLIITFSRKNVMCFVLGLFYLTPLALGCFLKRKSGHIMQLNT